MQIKSIIKGKISNSIEKTFGIFVIYIDHIASEVIIHAAVGSSSFINLYDIEGQSLENVLESMKGFLANGEASITLSEKVQKSLMGNAQGFLKYKNLAGAVNRIELALKTNLKALFDFAVNVRIVIGSFNDDSIPIHRSPIKDTKEMLFTEREITFRRTFNIDFADTIIAFNVSTSLAGKEAGSLAEGDQIYCYADSYYLEHNRDLLVGQDLVDEKNNLQKTIFPIKKIIPNGDTLSILLTVSPTITGVIDSVASEVKIEVYAPSQAAIDAQEQQEQAEQNAAAEENSLAAPQEPTPPPSIMDQNPLVAIIVQLIPFIIALLFILVVLL